MFTLLGLHAARAETLTTSNVQIVWKVANRFRFFKDEALFQQQEQAWRQYGQHVSTRNASTEDNAMFYYNSSVLGIEHVLNDRRIPFTNFLRSKFNWQGWAARAVDGTCYDSKSRTHAACGGVDAYINPTGHEVEIALKPLQGGKLVSEFICHWHVGDDAEQQAPCDEPIRTTIPYPDGATVSVNVEGERPISTDIHVKDLLVVGLGDSFASGEGNPDVPVQLDESRRVQNLYPARLNDSAAGSARWLDKLCHRSLYSYQLRAALQMAIENPHGAVTYLGYACSGAAVEKGLIGPQTYVEYKSSDASAQNPDVQALSGGRNDSEFSWLLRELCKVQPQWQGGLWTCPGQQFKRNVDFVFLSIGGNDIGFANLVSWATLRNGPVTRLAGWLGATVSPGQFAANMDSILPQAYERLARQLEKAVPLKTEGFEYDSSRVVLTAYPDILADENGGTCRASGNGGEPEDAFPANQSLDRFSNWLVVRQDKLEAAHAQLSVLHDKMKQLAEANGWTFATRAYADKPFRGHGFCAQRQDRLDDPAEVLMVPCWGKASRPTQSCQSGIFGQGTGWRPYDPATQNYPYALRQRWVRTINDAFMVMNQKVIDRYGAIDEVSSARDFTETTGAMHPSAEGHASLADAMLMDLRPEVAKAFGAE
ncbi:MAG: hypothetical protein KGO53_05885 [Alphaproteobacteria bacterium]|nr:hypothetical protein [Alphaproteobacteria bacterium]